MSEHITGGRRSCFGSAPLIPTLNSNPNPNPSPNSNSNTPIRSGPSSSSLSSSFSALSLTPSKPSSATAPAPAQDSTTSTTSTSSQESQKIVEIVEVIDFTDPSIFPPAGKHPPTATRAAKLIAQLKADLRPIPPISDRYDPETDLIALQALVFIVAKHAKATKPHWNETEFQEHLFELVMDRLPPSAVESFFTAKLPERDPRKKLPDARTFLADLLVEVSHAQQQQQKQLGGDRPPIYCSYCKEMTNHHITSCVKLTKRLCLHCFQFGHSSKFCKLPEAFPLEGEYYLMNGC